ncbi:unnamed protein product [Wuchereria bancrofti]|uniref:Uncharacterized protein n=1 Tax=Wuchereria bancrofti TaxID=6293 RepID=A0A3P7E5K7_WUCBA|nr:unnamed protein product [Wuchereria bancrofti]
MYMGRLWSHIQLNVGFYQHLDLTRSAQISDSVFILRKNIYEEDYKSFLVLFLTVIQFYKAPSTASED